MHGQREEIFFFVDFFQSWTKTFLQLDKVSLWCRDCTVYCTVYCTSCCTWRATKFYTSRGTILYWSLVSWTQAKFKVESKKNCKFSVGQVLWTSHLSGAVYSFPIIFKVGIQDFSPTSASTKICRIITFPDCWHNKFSSFRQNTKTTVNFLQRNKLTEFSRTKSV